MRLKTWITDTEDVKVDEITKKCIKSKDSRSIQRSIGELSYWENGRGSQKYQITDRWICNNFFHKTIYASYVFYQLSWRYRNIEKMK